MSATKVVGNRGRFTKGHAHVGGRKKGVPNKVTASIKAAVGEAFEKLGGVKSLVTWGKKNPDEFYRLWGRMAPHEIAGGDGGAIEIRVLYDNPLPE